MGRDGNGYLRELYSRLPRGPIWPTQDSEAPTWDALLDALANEFGRVAESAAAMLADFFPDACVQSLPDWERLLGLPDCGLALGTTVEERRAAVVAKLRRRGNPTLVNIQHQADAFGNGAVVSTSGTSDLFFVGSSTVGDTPVSNADAATQVNITYDAPQSDTFECAMRHAVPVHLTITFEVS